MKEETQILFESLKLISSFLTPILVFSGGYILSKRLEKNKLEALKEKEWQVRWADLFFKQATTFNDNVSAIVFSLDCISKEKDVTEINRLFSLVKSSFLKLKEIQWDIQNYAQFSNSYGKEVSTSQERLMEIISMNNQGSVEDIRTEQFKCNKLVKQAHSEILKMNT